ncbi:MAG TPA: hypothetical protein VMJ10_15290 [Kofleriaceae bacterium]|nr:hypothetical protein [Kofleriaceae bacterium]
MVRVLAIFYVLVACGGQASHDAAVGPATRAPAAGDFPDNPLLAHVPADTPYVFATFKPIPQEYATATFGRYVPVLRRMLDDAIAAHPDSEANDGLRFVRDELDTMSGPHLERLGFSPKARWVIYGLGLYPVARVELASGARVLDTAKRFAAAFHTTVPAPTRRGDSELWRIDDESKWTIVIALREHELVVAAAPPATIDANLAAILGEQKPPRAIDVAELRALAVRDGFTGQGLGFADVARIAALALPAATSVDCRAAVALAAHHVPRVAIGMDDLGAHHVGAGLVVELAPDILADARGLRGTLAGFDQLVAQKPVGAFAAAFDLERGRALLGRVATAAHVLAGRCSDSDLGELADELRRAATEPLPPYVAGAHGGLAAVTKLVVGPGGPTTIEGYGVLHHDHVGELVKLIAAELPELDLRADGRAHPLPAKLQYPGHFALAADALAVALGKDSERTATSLLSGKPVPAPLAYFSIDYSQLAPALGLEGPSAAIVSGFGPVTMQLTVDDRGLVMWSTMELH